MQEELTEHSIKHRVASGLVIFSVRRVLLQIIITLSNIILARVLTPEIFGIAAIISFIVLTFGLFTNFGLGPALVQTQKKISPKQLKSIFTIIVLSALAFAGIMYLLAPLALSFYRHQLSLKDIFWLRLFAFYILFNHLAAISKFLLQRNLEYFKLTIGEIVTTLVTQILIIAFAIKGLGVGSFVLGGLMGGLVSFLLFYYLFPWPIGLSFSIKDLKPFLSFGLNFQATNLIGAVNGAVNPVFVGLVSGPKAVGLVNWAAGIRQTGLAPFEVIQKLIFPSISRARKSAHLSKSLIEKMIKLSCMLSFPLLAIIFVLAPQLTAIVYTSKWMPGLTALYLSLVQGVFLMLQAIFIDTLLAFGKARDVRNINLFWAVMQWILTVPLVLIWNFNGVVLAGVIVSATFFIPLLLVRKYINIVVWPQIVPYILLTIPTGILLYYFKTTFFINSIWQIIFVSFIVLTVYASLLFLTKGKELIVDFKRFKQLVLNNYSSS